MSAASLDWSGGVNPSTWMSGVRQRHRPAFSRSPARRGQRRSSSSHTDGAGAALEPRAPSGGGYALAAEAARHDVHVAQGVPVYPGDVLQVRRARVAVGEHGVRAHIDVGHGDDPRAAERPLDGQVKPAVAEEQAYHSRFVFHATGYASPPTDASDGAWTGKRRGRWAVWPSGSG